MLSGQLVEGASALDVGSGSGYLTACMAEMCGEGGRVVGIDHVKELVEGSKVAVAAARADFAALELLVVDGFDGYPAGAPYDAIHVGAAAPTVPEKLVEQLNLGGRMVIPVGPDGGEQWIMTVDKDMAGQVSERRVMGVR